SMTARRSVLCWSRLPARLRRLPAMGRTIGTMSTVRSASVIRMRRSLCRHVHTNVIGTIINPSGAPTVRAWAAAQKFLVISALAVATALTARYVGFSWEEFAPDSPLEGDGFELSVPRERG